MKKVLVLCIALLPFLVFSCKQDVSKKDDNLEKNTSLSGTVFGTSYSIIYDDEVNYIIQFDSLFAAINASLSTYIPNSDISKLNRNELVEVDQHFKNVFSASKMIYKATQGVFDPTIGDVVNAWSFGAEENKFLTDSTTIDGLMEYVGFDNVKLEESKVVKLPNTYLEFNAIAKGYGVDAISEFLESKNINNYLVEIGGELRVKGKNKEKHKPWRVGLDEPRFDGGQTVFKAISLKDEAMATSGTYRKFKVDENGNRFAHIIDTKTGYPSKTNILSVSVIAKDCMTADGYATAFQAMGIDGVTTFLKSYPELKVFLIFENKANELETLALNGFPEG
ncbi:FAD:protein FMN transferase [Hyunsoonleella pacifica]|uniref:FAD:protein FMN transferase n=1 Tax=Hyunsoonleella pacifica TaxID=1080224 RepID=A0A4Q9FQK2_9FLAO|nr:FAD:protein FMN transferase [Hyunsoonleella pacifica]TBN15506.1 FAD:protein FMN transferase [Hyunsoonleella pacifica]GGD24645.1 FAD:protein FMN transferase [Hyunsoonleella pacifica]